MWVGGKERRKASHSTQNGYGQVTAHSIPSYHASTCYIHNLQAHVFCNKCPPLPSNHQQARASQHGECTVCFTLLDVRSLLLLEASHFGPLKSRGQDKIPPDLTQNRRQCTFTHLLTARRRVMWRSPWRRTRKMSWVREFDSGSSACISCLRGPMEPTRRMSNLLRRAKRSWFANASGAAPCVGRTSLSRNDATCPQEIEHQAC